MRTVRCSSRLLGGGVSAQGVSARGVYTSPRGQTDTCENITFPQLLLRTVIIDNREYQVVKVSPGGSYGLLENWKVCVPTACDCIKFKIYFYHLCLSVPAIYHCQHHWSCIPFWAKWQFIGPCHLQKFWGKKPKATTKVPLTSH